MKPPNIAIILLEFKIKVLRLRMVFNGRSKGLTHPHTIKLSQKLDVHLFKYQLITMLIKST
ncbi:hypothetical protein CR203_14625 [Salipaludibacillus neizhouensis]|uniref:Aspartyl-phosphate phosphatase Spo0E family protein n=1 Tax=Salipaludibacillus neizhouensis TaxID=885475 RepID=A0A3A9K1C0_9BACI|nr:aspartyl-phosphate phosphatase Spo0E family protein [Salipaludibacillus neizhouensis]RKL66527.1 hypothetical protein CR203_14625 [Salipaludibacillus neizhouensis]